MAPVPHETFQTAKLWRGCSDAARDQFKRGTISDSCASSISAAFRAIGKSPNADRASDHKLARLRGISACRHLRSCGRLDEAREIVARPRAITPRWLPTHFHLRSAEHRELYLSGLRLAAGETE